MSRSLERTQLLGLALGLNTPILECEPGHKVEVLHLFLTTNAAPNGQLNIATGPVGAESFYLVVEQNIPAGAYARIYDLRSFVVYPGERVMAGYYGGTGDAYCYVTYIDVDYSE